MSYFPIPPIAFNHHGNCFNNSGDDLNHLDSSSKLQFGASNELKWDNCGHESSKRSSYHNDNEEYPQKRLITTGNEFMTKLDVSFISKRNENELEETLFSRKMKDFTNGSEGQTRRTELINSENECSQILPHLFISGAKVAQSIDTLRHFNITRIVNCAPSAAARCKEDINGFDYLSVNMFDCQMEDITCFVCEIIHFIHQGFLNKKITLIHCEKGVSRSCAMAIAYHMWLCQSSWRQSQELISAARVIASPNVAFLTQLLEFDALLRDQNMKERSLLFRCAHHIQHLDDSPALKLCRTVSRQILPLSRNVLDERGVFVIRGRSSNVLYIWRGKHSNEALVPIIQKLCCYMRDIFVSHDASIVITSSGNEPTELTGLFEDGLSCGLGSSQHYQYSDIYFCSSTDASDAESHDDGRVIVTHRNCGARVNDYIQSQGDTEPVNSVNDVDQYCSFSTSDSSAIPLQHQRQCSIQKESDSVLATIVMDHSTSSPVRMNDDNSLSVSDVVDSPGVASVTRAVKTALHLSLTAVSDSLESDVSPSDPSTATTITPQNRLLQKVLEYIEGTKECSDYEDENEEGGILEIASQEDFSLGALSSAKRSMQVSPVSFSSVTRSPLISRRSSTPLTGSLQPYQFSSPGKTPSGSSVAVSREGRVFQFLEKNESDLESVMSSPRRVGRALKPRLYQARFHEASGSYKWIDLGLYDADDLDDVEMLLLLSPSQRHYLWIGAQFERCLKGLMQRSGGCDDEGGDVREEISSQSTVEWIMDHVDASDIKSKPRLKELLPLRANQFSLVRQNQECEDFWDVFESGQ